MIEDSGAVGWAPVGSFVRHAAVFGDTLVVAAYFATRMAQASKEKMTSTTRMLACAVVLFLFIPSSWAQPLEPTPMVGSISAAERANLRDFLQRFRSQGDYHAAGRVRIHAHGPGINCPENTSTGLSMLIYATGNEQYIVKSNNYYRIWGKYTVMNRATKEINTSAFCQSPFRDSFLTATSEKESISRFGAMPLLVVVDLLRNDDVIDGFLSGVKTVTFRRNIGNPDREYQLTLFMHEGGSLSLHFDRQARYMTYARYTFVPEFRPPGVDDMFADWVQNAEIVNAHRGNDTHRNEVAQEIGQAEGEATTKSAGAACGGGSGRPEAYTGSTGKSGMRRLVNWLCVKAGFESCAGSDD